MNINTVCGRPWTLPLFALLLSASGLGAAEADSGPAALARRRQEVAADARALLQLTSVGEWDAREFRRPGRWEELKAVRTAMDADDLPAALEGFKRMFLGKLRALDDHGLAVTRFDAFSGGPTHWKWLRPLISDGNRAALLAQAQELMRGALTAGGKTREIGEPGAVAWQPAVADGKERKPWDTWAWNLDAFAPLLAAYIITGETTYLDRWAAYADDWALNQRAGLSSIAMADIPDQWAGGAENLVTFLRYLSAVARLPGGAERFPAATFARVCDRLIVEHVPASVMYHRANPQNWNDLSAATLVDLGLVLDEFRCAPWLVRAGLRQFELITPTRHLPDGVDTDSTVGYGPAYLHGALPILERLKFRAHRLADWQLAAWERRDLRERFDLASFERRVREEMHRRARFQTAHLTAAGEWPIGGARTDHRDRARETVADVQTCVPEMLAQPDVAAILARTSGRGGPPPSFTSERFPYAGHAYLRAGWERDDPYLYFFCSPRPTVGSLSWRNNNAIGFSAFGQDLLETGENGTYDQPRSPLRVDGQEQFFHAGIPTWGHRGPLLTAWHEPAPWRWHASPAFDVAEGIYAGPFGKGRPITGVSHQRLVQAVRGGGLWIVTDRLRSDAAHDYSLEWRFGILPGKEPSDFLPQHIAVDAAAAQIGTARPKGSNLTLRSFPSTPLAITTSEDRTPEKNGYRLHDFLRVSASWRAERPSAVATAILPRRGAEPETRELKPANGAGTVGFSVILADGLEVWYQAAVEAPARLVAGQAVAQGESLLLTVARDGTTRLVVLGCRSLTVGGKAIALPAADAEVALTGGTVATTAIHTPLAPVSIMPADRAAFLDQQLVTLACASAGAEIRYTLDGSEPTVRSPLYRAPFTITASTVVKARALRPGLVEVPTTLSGTHASQSVRAEFTRLAPVAAVAVPKTVPGLRYETWAGRWQDLLLRRDALPPVASGTVDRLFAPASRSTAPTWAVRYRGWLDVPDDGLYTFQAPAESYMPDIMAGYELCLSIDGVEWYPATTLHALGSWSVALRKGAHSFELLYADLRGDAAGRLNQPGIQPMVWPGSEPLLLVSVADKPAVAIPQAWLRCLP
jgi:hypothetical protein